MHQIHPPQQVVESRVGAQAGVQNVSQRANPIDAQTIFNTDFV